MPDTREVPPLAVIEDAVTARYILSNDDVLNGAAWRIVEGLGYGAEQISHRNGLDFQASSRRVLHKKRYSCLLGTMPLGEGRVAVDVAVSLDACRFDDLGFVGLLSFLAGDVFGSAYARTGLVLEEIGVPAACGQSFPGPRYGSLDISERALGKGVDRPLVGILLKPDLGTSAEEYATLVKAAIQGGADYIKEDELSIDQIGYPRFRRIEAIGQAIARSGARTLYAANVTAKPSQLKETAQRAIGCGASIVLVNGVYVGLDAIADLATSKQACVPIHCHRAGFDILTSPPRSISVPCMSFLFRLAGSDVVHVGPIVGPLFSESLVQANCRSLATPCGGLKASLPVFSRCGSDSLENVLATGAAKPCLLLFDLWFYQSPLSIEREVKKVRQRLA